MNAALLVEKGFKKLIPAPFTLAVLLTLATMLLAFFFTGNPSVDSAANILTAWQFGMWDPPLLVFAVQMMLILVLGHVLVLSKPVSRLTTKLTSVVRSNTSAVVVVAVSTMLVAFFNWGLGLIFGAIMARKVAETAKIKGFRINYPLIGAAGYTGLMVWHGGMSGSAPLKAAEEGHLASLFPLAEDAAVLHALPSFISTEATIFSSWNLLLFAVLLIVIPAVLYLVSKAAPAKEIELPNEKPVHRNKIIEGAERLDHSKWLNALFGILLLAAFFISYWENILSANLTPNMLNFLMLGLCILMHGSFVSFLTALDEAIVGAAAILIQFPLYFGIMGIMRETGMVNDIAFFFAGIATEISLPVYTFFSAGLVNIFVPSGGGQWAVQGPVVLESALQLGVPLNKAIMAFAYGDQITNMLQPFWALPLLAITRLKAREILPYTLILMVTGTAIYITGLLLI
ncbi:short-chain fatty acids transporter [Salinimicrobium catena]|uniref:Short-chain fatty acids transporter n=1 Tax=Salinimicrobium catena TaxID=390640 RepID=A0A1H5L8P7_9FLAO|nr:TIGR00366 family protein [Salinimicrobium catena]SDL07075.1 short-chain fatty acids transporter [Salinimicrobium catena]SEE73429.1 short-chain fatty acids transporter [Salinimicrobium catena]